MKISDDPRKRKALERLIQGFEELQAQGIIRGLKVRQEGTVTVIEMGEIVLPPEKPTKK